MLKIPFVYIQCKGCSTLDIVLYCFRDVIISIKELFEFRQPYPKDAISGLSPVRVEMNCNFVALRYMERALQLSFNSARNK